MSNSNFVLIKLNNGFKNTRSEKFIDKNMSLSTILSIAGIGPQ